MPTQILRYRDGFFPHGLALCYAVIGYACGLVLIASQSATANTAGVLLLAHAMVINAYLIHECVHNNLFADNDHNARLGVLLSWITGSCYARYEDLRRKHFRHHVERADVIGFDYRRRLARYRIPAKLIAALEWSYIPAVELLLHALVILLPFIDAYYKQSRKRVLFILIVRAALFTALGLASMKAFLLYPAAYMLFLTALRFMDANQHTYELVETHEEAPLPGMARRDRDYEYRNTYSNLISTRYPIMNLLTLNFAYHNAHHDRPTVPWYRLPALHKELFGDDEGRVLSCGTLIRAFHKYRVERAFRPNGAEPASHDYQGPDLMGIDGISFLIPI